jgi:hypothetical protein
LDAIVGASIGFAIVGIIAGFTLIDHTVTAQVWRTLVRARISIEAVTVVTRLHTVLDDSVAAGRLTAVVSACVIVVGVSIIALLTLVKWRQPSIAISTARRRATI